ncbi:hypothetical protein PROFUN_02442 [Planoprotostelium fungivorum]|uniref:Uncharacterized protein n=1 Tax=Planoprotostelium fungivorum TaxID=1890364 RepID=A0A2P6NUU9_9EUKA|nr:hypothetical protein PROFUN_02442 [Planoprotostelium fungivorum]
MERRSVAGAPVETMLSSIVGELRVKSSRKMAWKKKATSWTKSRLQMLEIQTATEIERALVVMIETMEETREKTEKRTIETEETNVTARTMIVERTTAEGEITDKETITETKVDIVTKIEEISSRDDRTKESRDSNQGVSARDSRDRQKDEDDYEYMGSSNAAGEITMSVEETNKLRAQLGLKPLEVEDKKKEREERDKMIEQNKKDQKIVEINSQIERMKKKRALTQKLAGKSIAEEDDEDDGSAASWVVKSREKEKQLAAQFDDMDKELEEKKTKNAGKPSTSGLVVDHDVADFEETGEPIILTLKDDYILKDDGLNDDEFHLENVNMSERARAVKNQELKKKKPIYNVFEEQKSILAQYDDESVRNPQKQFVIGEGGVTEEKEQQEEIRQKLKSAAKLYNLDTDKKIATEYLRADEVKANPQAFKKKGGKKRATRQKQETEEDPVDISETPAQVAPESTEDMSVDQTDSNDLGSRSASRKTQRDSEKADAQSRLKEKNYRLAASKAAEDSRSMREMDQPLMDDDEKLAQELKRAKEMAQSRKGHEESEIAASVKKQAEEAARVAETLAATSVLFSPTTEFVKNIQVETYDPNDRQARRRPQEAARESDNAGEELAEEIKREARRKRAEEKERLRQQGGEPMEEGEQKVEEEEEEEGPVIEEPLVSDSLASTLALINSNKMLEVQDQVYVGRSNDRKLDYAAERDKKQGIKDRVNLVYRDDAGRVLTVQEAFRQACWRFHGMDPSKNTQARRMRQLEEQQKKMKMSSTDTPLQTVSAMQKEQERTQSAFVVLSKGNNTHTALPTAVESTKERVAKGDAAFEVTPLVMPRKQKYGPKKMAKK